MSTRKRSPAEKIAPPGEHSSQRKLTVINSLTPRLSRTSEEGESLRELIQSLVKNSRKKTEEAEELPPAA